MAPVLFLVLVCIVYLAMAAGFCYVIFRFYRFIFFDSDLFGTDLSSRLINVGITTLLFNSFGICLFVIPLRLIIRSTIQVAIDVSGIMSGSGTAVTFRQFSIFVDRTLSLVADTIHGPGLVVHLFLPLVFTIVLNRVLLSVFASSGGKYFLVPPVALRRMITANVRQNMTLLALIAASLYLVLCAIIAIPYSGMYHGTITPAAQKADSAKFTISTPDLNKNAIPLTWRGDSADIVKILNDPKLGSAKSSIAAKELQTIRLRAQNYFIPRYAALFDQVIRINNKLKNASKVFVQRCGEYNEDITKSELSEKLKYTYKADINKWLVYNKLSKEYTMSAVKDAVTGYTATLKAQVTDFQSRFSPYLSKLSDTAQIQVDTGQFAYLIRSNGPMTAFDDLAIGLDNFTDLPPRPSLGTEWGPLGDAAGWLIKTQSLDLALIVGMFGFGFLGAAISSFVNVRQNLKSNKPIVEDLLVVIIRGFSAAIVIFLATKGGVAIFNPASVGDPNPYVLFFTCLLGAVFSERIWGWARTQINSRYKDEGGDDPNISGGAAPVGGGPPNPPPAGTPAPGAPGKQPPGGEVSPSLH